MKTAARIPAIATEQEIVLATTNIILCPGQGAQAIGMGRKWFEGSSAAKKAFAQADRALGRSLGAPLSEICFKGPVDRLNQTDVSQPAIYVCSVASHQALIERDGPMPASATAGLSLGEYTALHLAGVFGFVEGLMLVAKRGQLMQEAARASRGGMVALVGASEAQAAEVCHEAAKGEILVCANFNAPDQIVLSGHADACQRAVEVAAAMNLKAAPLAVAGAFHSPLMQPAADRMAGALDQASFQNPNIAVWSNVTARPHDHANLELLKRRLVEQIIRPVRWCQTCQSLAGNAQTGADTRWHELAPGTVLRGLMRRIDRNIKVINHDQP
ncbi:MAG: ACP S-malonyltransferase [Phycisphaerales bacterium]|nr:ACP S-malonyltransferase [Phycisphaerales bacterium]MCI0632239.1 ACP S-malonyltransferase [Phycisphaerales bacterium]MCI0676278.1 ACP S-malonyltransferase [Phycisphaerales bacterium]